MAHKWQETATTLSYYSQFYKKKEELTSSRGTWWYSLQHIITELQTKRDDKSLIYSQNYFTLIRWTILKPEDL